MATAFETKAPMIMRSLMRDFDLDLESAAAILGNLGHESGGFKFLQEKQPLIPGSAGGYGWAQWTGPRRRLYEAYCKRNNLDPAGDKANYGFLFVELKSTEAKAIPAVKAATGLPAKVRAFELAFERAGVKHYPSREAWAAKALAAYRAETQATKSPTKDAGKVAGGAAAGGGAIVATGAAVEAGWSYGEITLLILGIVAGAVAGYFAWRWWQTRQSVGEVTDPLSKDPQALSRYADRLVRERAADSGVAAGEVEAPAVLTAPATEKRLSEAETAIADDLAAGIAATAMGKTAVAKECAVADTKPRRKPKKPVKKRLARPNKRKKRRA